MIVVKNEKMISEKKEDLQGGDRDARFVVEGEPVGTREAAVRAAVAGEALGLADQTRVRVGQRLDVGGRRHRRRRRVDGTARAVGQTVALQQRVARRAAQAVGGQRAAARRAAGVAAHTHPPVAVIPAPATQPLKLTISWSRFHSQ